MHSLMQDVRYVIRQLRARPRFTAAVLATLALGLGANVAVFGLANWVLLRPVPGVQDQERLVVVEFRDGQHRYARGTSYPNLADLAARVTALSGLAGETNRISVAIQAPGRVPAYAPAAFVSANYFAVLGTRVWPGRPFTSGDEIAAAQTPVAVISQRLWRRSFGGDSAAVGSYFTVNGKRTRVIGVAPADFHGIERIGLDGRVLAFAAAIALATGVAAGLIPALATVRSSVHQHLKAGAIQLSRSGGWLRGTLVTCQLALSLSLLVVMLLLVGTVRNLRAVDVGFDADSVTTFAINPASSGYAPDASREVMLQVIERIRAIPGVEQVAMTAVAPFMPTVGAGMRAVGGSGTDSVVAATSAWVSPEYFRTMGIPMLLGRTFTEDEMFWAFREPHPVVILSRTLARQLFGSEPALGRPVSTGMPGPPARVIGIVADSRWTSLTSEDERPVAYVPVPNIVDAAGATLLVRSPLSVPALRTAVERAVREVAPSVPVFEVKRLRERIEATIAEERVLARLLTAFTLLAVALATVGLYAVVAFAVAERTREFGIRIALGARPEQILRAVVHRGALLGGAGLVAGVAGAVALSRLVAGELYGVQPLEPSIYLLAAALLFVLVLLASLLPARQATRVDPMTALRAE